MMRAMRGRGYHSAHGLLAAGLLTGWWVGCVKHPQAVSQPELDAARWSPPVPAGSVVDGRFVDARLPLSVPVPENWRAEPASIEDATRVVLIDPSGAVRIRVSTMAAGTTGPEPRPDCAWAFEDFGSTAFPALAAVSLATCVPNDPDAARILGWYAPGAEPRIQVEVEAPPGSLLFAEGAALGVVGGVALGTR